MDTPPLIIADERRVTRPELALIGLVLAVAVTARLWNLSWGLPDVFEEATPFTIARTFWGDPGGHVAFNPDFFHYPALSFYIHFIGLGLRFLAGSVTGTYESLDAFRLAMATAPGEFIGGARFVSALFDAGTVYLVWSVTRAAFGRGAAAGAALLAAVNPLMIGSAQGVNVDVILTFFLMLTLRRTLHLGMDDSPRAYILAGMMIGLTASVKYTGAVSLLIPAGFLAARFVSSR